jgi:hypothetical protein
LKLTASPLVVSPQQIADAVTEAGFSITVVSPVSQNGRRLEVVCGDSYSDTNGRAIDFSSADWPTLTGASVDFNVTSTSGDPFTWDMTVVTGTGTKKVRLELTAAQTAAKSAGTYSYNVVATLASDVMTLVRGTMVIVE